ncbi:enoyl-CoA hydratase/carnithine racemase [Antricoccus suffuscus]|uniref:Enoyl-CoA hydratase/carnithine racemase n=1 Tax=Antricoccus suffuscus TaxID=1629062 RepID=A0A2T0ZWZ2_9ACTN|nr:enoyl-CoA hydratase/isomerase family protein [Antricoccus suffuscus]PRZ40853.1 enoyl-CoA hydratase/carnithine racemase [Antricoccus suffuscus]
MNETVTYESHQDVATIMIRRGNKLNALNNDVVEGLRDAWMRFEASDDRAAVLTSEGDRAFCVGADLSDPPAEMWEAVPGVGVSVTKPVVAAVFGHCVGGGYILSQHSDLAVVADNTVFMYPEARVGFTGGLCSGAAVRVPHKIAMEFLLLGEPLTAQRAYEVGMVNKVVPLGTQLEVATQMAQTIAQSAPLVVSTIKQFADRTVPLSPSEEAAHARRQLVQVSRSSDGQEGKAAFLEKRQPSFQGI